MRKICRGELLRVNGNSSNAESAIWGMNPRLDQHIETPHVQD